MGDVWVIMGITARARPGRARGCLGMRMLRHSWVKYSPHYLFFTGPDDGKFSPPYAATSSLLSLLSFTSQNYTLEYRFCVGATTFLSSRPIQRHLSTWCSYEIKPRQSPYILYHQETLTSQESKLSVSELLHAIQPRTSYLPRQILSPNRSRRLYIDYPERPRQV